MGVGLHLVGRRKARLFGGGLKLSSIDAWIRKACGEAWIDSSTGKDDSGQPTIFLQLHPCAEQVRLSLIQNNALLVSAKTSTTGPGYHRYLCGQLRALGEEFNLTWEPSDPNAGTGDETGYFSGGDPGEVDREMLAWLRGLGARVLEMVHDGYSAVGVSMPENCPYKEEGAILTPMGPRDQAWLEGLAANPASGRDLFPWRSDGLNASYWLGRAVSQMWMDVVWRPPLIDSEKQVQHDILHSLSKAYGLDPTLEYPWREWAELLRHTESTNPLSDVVEGRASAATGSRLIGYRRHPLRVPLQRGWSIEIPGSFATEWSDEGQTWSGWDGEKTVWFSSLSFRGKDGSLPSPERQFERPQKEVGETFVHRHEQMLGRAVLLRSVEDGEELWHLAAECAAPGNLGICNIYFNADADRGWALETWKSIRFKPES
jgi:hypothetical protein